MRGVDEQLDLFMNYITFVSPGALVALKNKDWKSFARNYNGPAHVDVYAKTIGDNYGKSR